MRVRCACDVRVVTRARAGVNGRVGGGGAATARLMKKASYHTSIKSSRRWCESESAFSFLTGIVYVLYGYLVRTNVVQKGSMISSQMSETRVAGGESSSCSFGTLGGKKTTTSLNPYFPLLASYPLVRSVTTTRAHTRTHSHTSHRGRTSSARYREIPRLAELDPPRASPKKKSQRRWAPSLAKSLKRSPSTR